MATEIYNLEEESQYINYRIDSLYDRLKTMARPRGLQLLSLGRDEA